MMVVIALVLTIGACISYFLGTTDLVDAEIRSLGAAQQLSFQKEDLTNSIKKWLEGRPNADCVSARNDLINIYGNFSLSEAASQRVYAQGNTSSPTPMNTFNAVHPSVAIPCFLTPSRYRNFAMRSFKAEFFRIGLPNYLGLTNEVGVRISFDMHFISRQGANKVFVQKFNLRFRLEASSLGNYALIFTDSPRSDAAISVSDAASTKVYVEGKTLILGPPPELTSLAWFGEGSSDHAEFNQEVHLSASHLVVDNQSLPFVTTNGLAQVFRRGLFMDSVPNTDTNPGYIYPTQAGGQAWQESFNPFYAALVGHLPFNATNRSAVPAVGPGSNSYFSTSVGASTLSTNDNRLIDTRRIFTTGPLGTNPANVANTCKVTSVDSAPLIVWGNRDTTFTIDLTGNTGITFPPIFCGMIIARKLIIKLNNLEASDPYSHHYLIGKFMVSEGIEIEGTGKVHIVDGLSFQREDIAIDTGAIVIDPGLIAQHLYAYSYSTYRNFFLPFLRPGVSYSTMIGNLQWAAPMSTVDWGFANPCPPPAVGYRCASTMNIPTATFGTSGQQIYPIIDETLPSLFVTAKALL